MSQFNLIVVIMYGRRRTYKAGRRALATDRKYPRRLYGTAKFRRGSDESRQFFGPSAAEATAEQRTARSMSGFTGKGGYWGQRAGDWLSGVTGVQGLGRMGSNVENQLINKGIGFLKGYTGQGAYQGGALTVNNSLVNPTGVEVPQIISNDSDATALTIVHREYCADIIGAVAFTNQSFLINPGSQELFPWLSQLAGNFDEYQFNQLIFGYKSVSADVTTGTSQIGSVLMAATENINAPAFNDKISMMEYESSVSAKVTENIAFGVECDPSKNALGGPLYVAPNLIIPAGEDVKTYIVSRLQIAVNACLTTGQVGELWVQYSVTLRKRKLFTRLGHSNPNTGMQTSTSGTAMAFPNFLGGVHGQQYNMPGNSLGNLGAFTGTVVPMTYFFGSWATRQLARASLWTQALANQYWLVANSVTGEVTMFLPDNFQGTHLMTTAFNLVTGNTLTCNDNYNTLSQSGKMSGSASYSAAQGVFNQRFASIIHVTTNANTAGIGGRNGVGSFHGVTFTWTVSATFSDVAVFGSVLSSFS